MPIDLPGIYNPHPAPPVALNPELNISPEQLSRDHARKEKVWNTTKKVALVAVLVLAASALVATSIFAPHLIIWVTMGLLIAGQATSDGLSYANDRAAYHAVQKMKYTRISEIQKELDDLSPDDLRYRFGECGIRPDLIERYEDLDGFKSLTTGLASLLYYCERMQQIFEDRNRLVEEIRENDASDAARPLMEDAFDLERGAMAAQINAAYMHALLRDPTNQKSLNEIGALPLWKAENYALAKLYGGNREVFVFHDKDRSSLQESDLEPIHYPRQLRSLGDDLFAG